MTHTEYVRDEFWGGGPVLDVFVVQNYEPVDAEREMVNEFLGYKESFWPQGLWGVSDDRPTEKLVRRFEI